MSRRAFTDRNAVTSRQVASGYGCDKFAFGHLHFVPVQQSTALRACKIAAIYYPHSGMLPSLPDDESSCLGTRDWPHAPPHRLAQAGVYFLTARTLGKVHHFAKPDRRTFLLECLLALAGKYRWTLEAWAVLSNHYHFVAHSPEGEDSAESLRRFVTQLHADTSRTINRFDKVTGRKVWHSFRETHLTLQRGYLARLHYVHANAVHHGIVRVASEYEWCSAKKFKEACTPAWVKTIRSFRYDEIAVEDGDIEP